MLFYKKEGSNDMIALSELLHKMKEELTNLSVPNELPTVPDMENFQLPTVLPSNNCNGNDKAISLDIQDTSGALEITICTFLEYELEGELSADGLLDELDEYISLELDSGFLVKGAFSTGIKLTVVSLTELPLVELDPLTAQLYLQTDFSGTATLGLFEAAVSGNASLEGQLNIGYCPSCNGTYLEDGYQQAGQDSSFYFNRLMGYYLGGGIELSAGMPGVELDLGAEIGIEDDNIFDDNPSIIQLPDTQSLRDSIKFSPQNAVSKLQVVNIFCSFLYMHPTLTHPLPLFFRYAATCRCHLCASIR